MAKKTKTAKAAEKTPTVSEEASIDDVVLQKVDILCPSCGKGVDSHKCRLCGATRTINSVSGNVIWMRNGRLVAAFHDDKDAYVKMALRYNIPKEEWPERFRN